MNGVDVKNLNYYIGEVGMELQVKYFMKNAITKGLPFAYIKIIKITFLVDILLYLGQIKVVNILLQIVLFFTLTNIHNLKPTKFPNLGEDMVFHEPNYGATFNDDIIIYSDFAKESCCSSFPSKYQDILGKGKSIFTNNDSTELKIKEIEIFKLLK